MPAGYDAEVAELFRDLRAATTLTEMDLAARLGTRPDVVQALEQGALYALPPWPETCRVVNAYGAILNLDVRPLLRRIYAQLEAGIVELQPKAMPEMPMMTPPETADYGFGNSGNSGHGGNSAASARPNPLDIPWPPPEAQRPPQPQQRPPQPAPQAPRPNAGAQPQPQNAWPQPHPAQQRPQAWPGTQPPPQAPRPQPPQQARPATPQACSRSAAAAAPQMRPAQAPAPQPQPQPMPPRQAPPPQPAAASMPISVSPSRRCLSRAEAQAAPARALEMGARRSHCLGGGVRTMVRAQPCARPVGAAEPRAAARSIRTIRAAARPTGCRAPGL